MKIGDMTIDAIVDGECVMPTEAVYLNRGPEDWKEYEQFLAPSAPGSNLFTLGGYLVTQGDRLILVDAGVGPKATFPFVGGALRSALINRGVATSDITDVIFTHLHNDHIGWASIDGRPYFENATYHCDRRDWDHFVRPDYPMPEWEAAFTDPAVDAAFVRLAPVADRMHFFEGDDSVLPGIESWEASGHTPGTTVLKLTDHGESVALIGDLSHTEPELIADDWDFMAHEDHKEGLQAIERIRKRLYDEKLLFAAAHYPGMHFGRLTMDNGKIGYEQVPD
jgi:glyoxylase-like metal-dependent hydrolase (beta-lactamase superfamily II)